MQDNSINIEKGYILSGPLWPNQVKVVKVIEVEKTNGNFYISVLDLATNQSSEYYLTKDNLKNIKIIKNKTYFNEDATKVFLALESIRFRYASLYDPLLAMNVSKVDPLPHQIDAVYGYVLKQSQIRFLIADDPGAGKTIMAGLIIKELKLRHMVKRILIVVPSHLKDQWRRELKERFNEDFEIIDRYRFNNTYQSNIWEKENQIITSMDFAKKDNILATINAVEFDLVIVDEAHKMSAYQYSDKIQKSDRYKLGEVLSKNSNHMLFLTATPHKGDPDNFRLFLDLLKKGFFANNELIQESIINKDNPLFIRRIKEDLKDFEGKPLFTKRDVKTVRLNLGIKSPTEKELYNELSKYVQEQYDLAKSKISNKRRSFAFAMVTLQRRFASSIYALYKSLLRRKEKLLEFLNSTPQDIELPDITEEEFEEYEDMEEEEQLNKELEWETLSSATSLEELKQEIKTLESLIEKAKDIIEKENELKLVQLKESLDELSKKVPEKNQRKILIFTESRDTLEYLQKKIKEWGYTVTSIHGGMKLEDRIEAEKIFKEQTDILIATDAAGEGINLQFCNLMVNYDIPWNPNRLEQRMGRIHRYGQTKEVFIHNLVAIDTREGRVFDLLFEKIKKIQDALGSDKVFDVLGQIIDAKKFKEAIVDAALNAKSIEEIEKIIEIQLDEEYIKGVKEKLGETLATRYIDYTRIKEISMEAKENRLIPEYTKNFFIKAIEKAGGKVKEKDKNIISLDVPLEIRRIAKDEDFKKRFGIILEKYTNITFDKEIAMKNSNLEFVSFGHPLFEAVLKWIDKNFKDTLQTGATFYDYDQKLNGYILFYEGEIEDGKNKTTGKRLFSVYIGENGEKKIIHPSILWDLGKDEKPQEQSINIDELENKAKKILFEPLSKYKEELLKEQIRQAKIKEKYGKESLRQLILKLDRDLIELQERKERGENVDLAIRNKEERKKEYEESLKELEDSIEREQNLKIKSPIKLGIVRVKPATSQNIMVSDEEIEKAGMEFVINYEKQQNRTPEDVSRENLGFDIRSVDSNGNVRYIEVKARAEVGDIVLTKNEMMKAKQFGNDYYLYVVYYAANYPKLIIIQNPAENLQPKEIFEQVRYIVDKNQILNQG